MNGPRFQIVNVDGLENGSSPKGSNGMIASGAYHSNGVTSKDNLYPYWNDIYIQDKLDGRQSICMPQWATSNQISTIYSTKWRYALRTTTPNYFIIVSYYSETVTVYNYVATGTMPVQSGLPYKTLIVELPKSEWKDRNNAATIPPSISRGFAPGGKVSWSQYINNTANDSDGYTAQKGFITRDSSDPNKYIYTFEFQSDIYSLKVVNDSFNRLVPYNFHGKKMGNQGDRVVPDMSSANGVIAEVYSPIKGCLCLKSYVNGEIPILN